MPKEKSESPSDGAPESPKKRSMFSRLALAGVGGFSFAPDALMSLLRRSSDKPDEESEEGIAFPSEDEPDASESESEETEERGKPDWLDGSINRVLHTLSVASRADVEAVAARLDRLTDAVERLREQRG